MKLINKATVVAEIEKLQLCTMDEYMNFYSAEAQGEYNALSKLESFLDTLEVKEVDLEKEIDKWWCSLYTDYSMKRVPNHKFVPEPSYMDSNFKQSETGKTKIAFALYIDWKVDSNDIEWDADTVREFAKHFFELGLKAQKGK